MLFRVNQERLVDIYRLSGSGTAAVRLQRDSGLLAMRERLRQLGGQLEILTGTHGTTVTAVAPLMVEGHAAHPAR